MNIIDLYFSTFKEADLSFGLILRSKEVKPLSNHIPDCSCGSHSCTKPGGGEWFRWGTWYTSGKRSKNLFPFLNWTHFTKEAMPVLQGTEQHFPQQLAAAALSTSFILSSINTPTEPLWSTPYTNWPLGRCWLASGKTCYALAPTFPLLLIP